MCWSAGRRRSARPEQSGRDIRRIRTGRRPDDAQRNEYDEVKCGGLTCSPCEPHEGHQCDVVTAGFRDLQDELVDHRRTGTARSIDGSFIRRTPVALRSNSSRVKARFMGKIMRAY